MLTISASVIMLQAKEKMIIIYFYDESMNTQKKYDSQDGLVEGESERYKNQI